MKRIRLIVAALLLGMAFGPAGSLAGNPDLITVEGATPAQEAILLEVTAWPGVPDLARPITIYVCEGCPNQAGATGMTLNSFVPDVNYIGNTFLHEYGHVWDYHFLSIEDRQAIIDLHDVPYGWYGGPYMVRPAERFAGTFAKAMMADAGYLVGETFESVAPPFTDIGDLSQESQEAILWLYDVGITKGTTFTTYGPSEFVTREQVALFFYRALN